MNYNEAMTGAETRGTGRRDKRRLLYRRLVWSCAVVILTWMVVFWGAGPLNSYVTKREKEKEQAAVTMRQQKVTPIAQAATMGSAPMILKLAPGAKSERIPVPHMMHVVGGGKDFLWHFVYADGRDVTGKPGDALPANGDMPFVYVENLRKEDPNVVIIRYEK